MSSFARVAATAMAVCAAALAWAPDASGQIIGMSISPSTITFASADPDTTPILVAPAVSVTYIVLFSGGAGWRITLEATDDLRDGAASIPVSNVTWTASPAPPFQAGVLSRASARTLASGSGDQWMDAGQVVFSLPNSWNYNVGTYSTSVVFTLICP